jgi:hypothetical protein
MIIGMRNVGYNAASGGLVTDHVVVRRALSSSQAFGFYKVALQGGIRVRNATDMEVKPSRDCLAE